MLEKISQNNGYPKKKDVIKRLKKIRNKKTLLNQKRRIKTIFNQFSNSLARAAPKPPISLQKSLINPSITEAFPFKVHQT